MPYEKKNLSPEYANLLIKFENEAGGAPLMPVSGGEKTWRSSSSSSRSSSSTLNILCTDDAGHDDTEAESEGVSVNDEAWSAGAAKT